jgi:polysaccharide biosynthesis protein PelD
VEVKPFAIDTVATPPLWCGLRRSAVLEIALYLGVMSAVDFLFLGGSRFWDWGLHPFWPIVILVSAQYGTGEGLFASLCATAALLTGTFPERSMTQDDFEYSLLLIRNPLMWSVASILLGELRKRHKDAAENLQLRLIEVQTQAAELGRSHAHLAQTKEKLELRVAGQLRTSIAMFDAARGVDTLEPHEVVAGVAKIVRAVMNPEKFSLFLLHGAGLERSVEAGWQASDPLANRFTSESPLFREVIGRQRFLCAASAEDHAALQGQGILAGPVAAPGSGDIVGMLKIEKLGFLDLNVSSVQTFRVLCEWIGAAYANALRYQAASAEALVNEETTLYSFSFFKRQTAFLCGLARRVGFDVTMLVLRVENGPALKEEDRLQALLLMSSAVKAVLRTTDMAFDSQRSDVECSIVLPNTSAETAEIVQAKLLAHLSAGSLAEARFAADIHVLYDSRGKQTEATTEIGGFPSMLPDDTWPLFDRFIDALSRRVGFPVSASIFKLSRPLDIEEKPEVSGIVKATILEMGLETALLFDSPVNASFRLLLPGVEEHQALSLPEQVADSVNRALAQRGLDLTVALAMPDLSLENREVLHV